MTENINIAITTIQKIVPSREINIPLIIGLSIALIILIFLSSYFSGCESSFSSLTKEKWALYKQQKKKSSFPIKSMDVLTKNFAMTLSTVLIGNNLVNVGATTIATVLFTEFFKIGGLQNDESLVLGVSTGVMTLLVIIFGEYIPKNFAKKNALKFSLICSPTLVIFYYIFLPISITFNFLFKIKKSEKVTEEEISHLIDIAEDDKIFENFEAELIKNAMSFDDKVVENAMKKNIITININDNCEEILHLFMSSRYTRLPVIKNNDIIGILNLKNFLNKYIEKKTWDFKIDISMLDLVVFTSKLEKLDDLLKKMKILKKHMAIVVENKKIIGLITLEDLLEELVGEIYDEQDVIISDVQNFHTNSWIVNLNTNAKKFFHLNFPEIKIQVDSTLTMQNYVKKEFNTNKLSNKEIYENEFLMVFLIKHWETKKNVLEIIKK
ncbi:MAG: CNNM domain-containing protein [Malacoplasma sp.]